MDMGLRVCHISSAHRNTDDRIFLKECVTLAQKGYTVTLIAKGVVSDNSMINQILFPDYHSRFGRFVAGGVKMLSYCLRRNDDLIHFHDPELLWVALILKLTGRKIIYDVHEDLPRQILNKQYIPIAFRRILAVLIEITERVASCFFDGIVAATDDIARRFNPKKTSVVRNLPVMGMRNFVYDKKNDPSVLRLIYVGGLSYDRGILETIQITGILNKSVSCRIWLAGDWESAAFFQRCRNLDAWQFVDFLGYLQPAEVYNHISNSDIGVCLLHPLPNYVSSLPVKSFEYMMFGKPMIMSDFPYWLSQYKGAAVFSDPFDIQGAVDKILALWQNPSLYSSVSSFSSGLILSELNWETEAAKLLNRYHAVLTKGVK